MAEAQVGSILALDIGSVTTQAVLVARVEGTYRFVARAQSPTTVEAPWADVAVGARHAIEQLMAIIDRSLLDGSGDVIVPEREDGSGVDLCVITTSAAQPLRIILAGLVNELSVESLRRAAAGTYAQVEDVIAVLGTERLDDNARAKRILGARPDAVCIAGGSEGGAAGPVLSLVESVSLGASLIEPDARPTLVYAGNSKLRPRVKELAGNEVPLVIVEGNVRPSLMVEDPGPLQSELEALHASNKMASIHGLGTCAAWSRLPVLPTARAFGHVVQYLSMTGDMKRGALGVDVGAANTLLAAAFKGEIQVTVRSDAGSAFGGPRFLREAGAANVARWLPFDVSAEELEAFFINKELHPLTIPPDGRELLIEQALTREAIRSVAKLARPGWARLTGQPHSTFTPMLEQIIGAGAVLTQAPRPGQAALMLLDAIEPIGVTTLLLDEYGLMPALGAVAVVHPLSTVQTIENNGLSLLGTAVVPVGHAHLGEIVLGVKISYEIGGDLEVEVAAGTLEVLPLPAGHKATLQLQPRRGIDIGYGPGRGGRPIQVEGSTLGLIVDARGRPLVSYLPSDPEQRRDRIQQWLWDMGT